jgi:RimJ/RimL family protein N-acetyltransferase
VSASYLRPISAAAASAVLAGRRPDDVQVADDFPTEFSSGVAQQVGQGTSTTALGPFFIHRATDDVVVGEIGGAVIAPGVVEIGYAVVASCWGRGHATDAVRALVELARTLPRIERIVANHPVDRLASGRVLEKAGFTCLGDAEDEHEGVRLQVKRWELVHPPGPAPSH